MFPRKSPRCRYDRYEKRPSVEQVFPLISNLKHDTLGASLARTPLRIVSNYELFVQVFFLYGSDNAKKSVGLVADPGREIKPIIKKVESPESVEIQWFSTAVLQRINKIAAVNVEGVDFTVPKVARLARRWDQSHQTCGETHRTHAVPSLDPRGGVQLTVGDEAFHQVAVISIKDVNETVP